HQTDESVLQPRRTLPPIVRLVTEGRDGAFERGGVVTAHVQRIAKGNRLLHSGSFTQLFAQFREIGSTHRPNRQADARNHYIRGSSGKQFAFGNISKALTSLSLIHVVGGDEKGQRLCGELMNLFPKIASRFWIDTRCRLVQ